MKISEESEGMENVPKEKKEVKLWRPKDKRAVAIIKVGLWAGLLTWAILTVGFGIAASKMVAGLLGQMGIPEVWIWVTPIWIVFTSFMLVWAVLNFANKKLRG